MTRSTTKIREICRVRQQFLCSNWNRPTFFYASLYIFHIRATNNFFPQSFFLSVTWVIEKNVILSVAKSENLSKQFLYEKPSKGLKYLVITFTAHELALYAPPEESYDYVHVCKGTSDRGTLGRSSKSLHHTDFSQILRKVCKEFLQ